MIGKAFWSWYPVSDLSQMNSIESSILAKLASKAESMGWVHTTREWDEHSMLLSWSGSSIFSDPPMRDFVVKIQNEHITVKCAKDGVLVDRIPMADQHFDKTFERILQEEGK
jgi:hypothetical protein